jgi:hypothetical protein
MRLAVAVHDVGPATFERCALIRDWLDDLGVARLTLVVHATHPLAAGAPALAAWLAERRARGDAVTAPGRRRPAVRPGWAHGPVLHVDIRPGDLDRALRVRALQRVLRVAGRPGAVDRGGLSA